MRVILTVAAFTLLGACAATSNSTHAKPATAASTNQLRKAPCACVEIKQKTGLPDFLTHETANA